MMRTAILTLSLMGSLMGSLHAADQAAASTIELANDQAYAEKVQAVLAERPTGKDQQQQFRWLWSYFAACMDNRAYADAEIAARTMMVVLPRYNLVDSNLSVVLGKQGKYQEALQEAEIAKLLDPADSMHADAVACSWLFYLGRKQEAITRFQHIPVPTDVHALPFYWGCKACFYASVGIVDEIKTSITNALAADASNRSFFERDIVFDRYRAEPWFIALVGTTLK